MFLETVEGLRAENVCVYRADVPSGYLFELQQSSPDAADLLFYLKEGAVMLQEDGVPLMPLDKTAYIPCGGRYSLHFSRQSAFVLASFRLFKMNERISLPHPLSFKAAADASFVRLEAAASIAGAAGDLRRKAALLEVFSELQPEFAAYDLSKYVRIAQGVAALEEQFLNNVPISTYAALCDLRENRFRLLFTEHFGVSPVEYRNGLRMRYARALMDELHCSVAEAARAAGFANTSYFCRLYRKMFGTSPTGTEDQDGTMDKTV